MNSDGELIGRRRLRSQRLVAPACDDPADVVRWMGAMQAQDYGQSLWAVACRLRRPSLETVERAIETGAIVRTWPMRGTMHWVPAEDAAWMVELSGERMIAATRSRRGQLGMDDGIIDRARDSLVGELSGGRRLNRPAVMKLWKSARINVEGQRGYHLLWHLAIEGRIAVGPMDGRQQTFVLLDEWAATPRRLSREAGLAELARRYVQSHGPVADRDFAWWAGITLTDARRGLAGSGFDVTTVGDRELWRPSSIRAPRNPGVQLLAGFDEFVLGYQFRGDVLEPEFTTRVVPGMNGIFKPCVVAAGRVVGVWKRLVRKGSVDITVELFGPRSVVAAELEAAAGRYAEHLGVDLGRLDVDP